MKDDELILKATPTPGIFNNQLNACFLVIFPIRGRIYYKEIFCPKLKPSSYLIYWEHWKQNGDSWPFIRVCFVAGTELSLSLSNSYNSIQQY